MTIISKAASEKITSEKAKGGQVNQIWKKTEEVGGVLFDKICSLS